MHFALDSMDVGRASRSRDDDPGDSITNSELRSAFEHRNDPEVRRNTHFYDDYAERTPPWNRSPEPWIDYERELRGRDPDRVRRWR